MGGHVCAAGGPEAAAEAKPLLLPDTRLGFQLWMCCVRSGETALAFLGQVMGAGRTPWLHAQAATGA